MDKQQYQLVKQLFNEARRLKGGEREAMLRERCGSNGEIFSAVEAMLAQD